MGALGIGLGAGGFGYAATNLIKGTAGAYIDRTSTEAGLAGLTNTYTKFGDFNQKPVSAATNFTLSVNSAKALYERLREASKETLVTPQELAESFMSGAPALRNKGFSEDQALKLTSRIVAMGRAMNLPSAAIQSDIRDFARGSVTRNSQVLQALGLSTEGLKEATAKGPEAAMAYFNERVAGFEPAFKKLREELPGQINEMRIELEKAAQDIGMYATPNIIKGIQAIRKELVSFGESGGFERLGTQLGQLVNGVATMFQTAAPLIMTATSSMEAAIVSTLGGALAFVTLQSLAAASPLRAFGLGIAAFVGLLIMNKERLMRESVQEDWEAGNKSVEIFGEKSKVSPAEKIVGVRDLQEINAVRFGKGQKLLTPKDYAKDYLGLKAKFPAIASLSGLTDSAQGEGDSSASQPGWWQGWQGLARTFWQDKRPFDRAAAEDAVGKAETIFTKNIAPDAQAKKYYEDSYKEAASATLESLIDDVFNFVNNLGNNPDMGGTKRLSYAQYKAKFDELKNRGVTSQAFTNQAAIIDAIKNPKNAAAIQSQKAVIAAGEDANKQLSGALAAAQEAKKKVKDAGGSDESAQVAGEEAYRMYNTQSFSGGGGNAAGKDKKQTSALEAKIAQLQYAANQADRYVQRTSDFAISGGGYLKLNALGRSMDAGIAVARAEYELGMANAKENELGPYEQERLQTQLQQSITNVTNAYEDQRRQMELNIEQQKMQNKLLSESNEIKRKELQYAEKEFQVSKIDKDDIQGGYAARMGLLQEKYGLTRMRYASSLTQISESDRIRRLEYAEASKSTMNTISNAALDDGMSSTGMSQSTPGGTFTLGNQFGNTQTSGFGPRRRPSTFGGKQGSKNHGGIDYGVPTGTKIRAQADGKVIFAGSKGGYGFYLQIDHGPVVTAYGHLSKIFVRVGDIVTKGQVVALSGGGKNDPGRGNSSGAHVHFETRVNGKTVNPANIYGKQFTSSGFKSSGTTFAKPLSMAASGVNYDLLDEDVRLQYDQAMLDGPRTDMQTLRQGAFSEGYKMAGETAAKSTLEMGKRGARYDVLNNEYESNAQRQRAIQLFDAQQRFDLLKESTGRRMRDYSTIVGERASRIFDLRANLGSGGTYETMLDIAEIAKLEKLNATEPQKAFDALFNALNNAKNALSEFNKEIIRANELEKARNDRDALGIEQSIAAGTRGYDKSMSRLGGSGRIDAGFFSTDSIRGTYTEAGAAAQESAQSQLDMQIANDKATEVIKYERVGMYGIKPRKLTRYQLNLEKDPQYYNKIRQANISRIQGNTLSAAGKDRLLGNPRLSGLISGGIGSLGSLDAYGLLSNPEGRLDAIKGLVSPLTSMGADDKNSALSMLAAGAFASDASMMGNPAFNKYFEISAVGKYGLPTKAGFNRKKMMADAASSAAAQFGGDIAGNFIGTSLFRNTDPGAIGLGTSMGSTLGSMAGSGLLGTGGAALFAPLGPWAPVVGAVLGGMLGGMFGGKKKDPREQQEKENRKQFQRRIEDILNNIDKSLGPQSDYYRAIRGDLLYGAASSYYSGRAYSRMGIGYNTGGR
jgi:murein DD-endopeptidase MepM/ murein hydrolase activator NlpD